MRDVTCEAPRGAELKGSSQARKGEAKSRLTELPVQAAGIRPQPHLKKIRTLPRDLFGPRTKRPW